MLVIETLMILGAVFVLSLFGYIFVKARYKKAGPDEALIVFGRKQLARKRVIATQKVLTGLAAFSLLPLQNNFSAGLAITPSTPL